MKFVTTYCGGDFATIEGIDSQAWNLFEQNAKEVFPRDVWYNNPEHYRVTLKAVKTADPRKLKVQIYIADRRTVASYNSTRKLLRCIYNAYKGSSTDDAKLITYCAKRLLNADR